MRTHSSVHSSGNFSRSKMLKSSAKDSSRFFLSSGSKHKDLWYSYFHKNIKNSFFLSRTKYERKFSHHNVQEIHFSPTKFSPFQAFCSSQFVLEHFSNDRKSNEWLNHRTVFPSASSNKVGSLDYLFALLICRLVTQVWCGSPEGEAVEDKTVFDQVCKALEKEEWNEAICYLDKVTNCEPEKMTFYQIALETLPEMREAVVNALIVHLKENGEDKVFEYLFSHFEAKKAKSKGSKEESDQCLAYLRFAIMVARVRKDLPNELKACEKMGTYLNEDLQRVSEAVNYCERRLEIASQLGYVSDISDAHNKLGGVYCRLSKYEEAIDQHKAMLELAKDAHNKKREGRAYYSLSDDYFRKGDWSESRVYGEKCLPIAEEIGDAALEGLANYILGSCAFRFGQDELAEEYYKTSIKIGPKSDATKRKRKGLMAIGMLKGKQEKYEEAIKKLDEALEITEESNKIDLGTIYTNLGQCYDGWGDFDKALECYKKALDCCKQTNYKHTHRKILDSLGKGYLKINDLEKAYFYFESGLKEAEGKDPVDQAVAYLGIGNVYFKKEKYLEAREFFEKAIEIYETQRNTVKDQDTIITLVENQAQAYKYYEETFVKTKEYSRALEIIDSYRFHTLKMTLQKEIVKSNSEIKSFAISDIQNYIQSKQTTAIVYSVSPSSPCLFYAWVISPEGDIKFKELDASVLRDKGLVPKGDQTSKRVIDHVIDGMNQDLAVRGKGQTEFLAAKSHIYQSLILPLERDGLIKKNPNHTLTLFPDTNLLRLSFAAAFDEQTNEYLIEKWNLAMAPSFSILTLLEQIEDKGLKEKPCLIGNSTGNLPEASYEVISIGKMLNVFPYLDEEAKKSNLSDRITKSGLLHFAVHGHNIGQSKRYSPFLGSLQFRDAFWFASDIVNSELSADLAFLSACNSGRGREMQEGYIGLPYSFLAAKVPSVIATHWKINDREAADIAVTFYRHYLGMSPESQKFGRKLTKGEALSWALRQAAIDRKHPSTWGAFFLFGVNDHKEIVDDISIESDLS